MVNKILLVALIVIVISIIIDNLPRKNMNRLRFRLNRNASGIIFGRKAWLRVCSPEAAEGHIAVFGGSGKGKTSAILVPTLKKWRNTAFVIDVAGDICRNVQDRDKLVYDPENPSTVPYNVFGAVDEEWQNPIEQKEMLEQLAHLIMPDDAQRTSDAAIFFHSGGRNILMSALLCYYKQGWDFCEICEHIVGNDWKALLNDIASYDYQDANSYIASFSGASEQNTIGCKQSTDKAIQLFATNEKMKRSIRRPADGEPCITPSTLEERSVYIVIADEKLQLYAPLLKMITSQSLEYFSTKRTVTKNTSTVLFCLDEFTSCGCIGITDALRKLRKRKVRILILTQSMADLDLIYGKAERMAMMNNFAYKVVLSCEDSDTQEYFAKLIGRIRPRARRNLFGFSTSIQDVAPQREEWIIPPEHLARLGNNLILLAPCKKGYMKLRKNFYFKR